MYTCDQYADLFWDQLYGLLDEDQAQELHQHLAGCSACQAVRVQVEVQQRLVARVARLYDTTPFLIPEPESVSAAAVEPAAAQTPPVPATLPLPARKAGSRRRWPWLAAAAALLLLVGGYAWYHRGLAQRRQDLDQAGRSVQEVKDQLAAVTQAAERQLRTLPSTLRSRQVQLTVLGPATYQPGAPSQYRVVTRDLNGSAAPARVTARVVAMAPNRSALVLATKTYHSRGNLRVSLPTDLKVPAGSTARLEVEAQRDAVREQVRQDLALASPSYTTRLTLDRSVYRLDGRRQAMLFFRTLTLERVSRTPPGQPFVLRATLFDGAGIRRGQHHGPTRAGGLGGGEFALTEDFCPGECLLEVSEARQRFPTVRRRFVVVGSQPPPLNKTLTFDQPAYNPGDEIRAHFQVGQVQNGPPVVNRPVLARVTVDGQRLPVPVSSTNAQGEVTLRFLLPRVQAGTQARLDIWVNNGKEWEPLLKPIPLKTSPSPAGPAVDVEFFPEGGSLVAGLPGRVYFRVRAQSGAPADLEGTVVDGSGRDVVKVQTRRQQGLGSVRFTPRAGESYALRVTTPTGVTDRPRLPEVQPSGVGLSVPAGVSREGQPIRVAVFHRGARRAVLITAIARGRLVDQKAVVLASEETEVTLTPAAGAHGVLRITVHQARQGRLVPLAERLVYRLPARRLQVRVNTDKPRYQPGERVTLTIKTTDETGKPAPSWLLAAVVDAKAVGPAAWNGPVPFYLASEIRQPEDLEEADVWVRNDAQAFAALDRFLGTQGWRRFRAPAVPVKADAVAVRAAVARGAVAFLQLDNAADARRRYDRALITAAQAIRAANHRQATALATRGQQGAEAVEQARTALVDFETLPATLLRRGVALLVLVLLATGCLALLIALVRTVRGAVANTPYFATAFASLLVCLILVYLGKQGQREGRRDTTGGPTEFAWTQPRLDLPSDARILGTREVVPGGLYAALPRSAVQPDEADATAQTRGKAKDQALAALVNGNKASLPQKDPNEVKGALTDLQRRYAAMKNLQRGAQGSAASQSSNTNPRMVPLVRPVPRIKSSMIIRPKGKVPDRPETLVPVEYAHVHPRGRATGPDTQETVLWCPALVAGDGSARIAFDLSDNVTTFRVLVHGNSQDGRQGVALEKLASGPAPRASVPVPRGK